MEVNLERLRDMHKVSERKRVTFFFSLAAVFALAFASCSACFFNTGIRRLVCFWLSNFIVLCSLFSFRPHNFRFKSIHSIAPLHHKDCVLIYISSSVTDTPFVLTPARVKHHPCKVFKSVFVYFNRNYKNTDSSYLDLPSGSLQSNLNSNAIAST